MVIKINRTQLIYYIVFIIFFLFSTNIILLFFHGNSNSVRSVNYEDYDHFPNDIDFRIDTFYETKNIFFSVEFTGWAYINKTKDSENKYIKLIFVSDDNSFEIETDIVDRFDLMSQLTANNIKGLNHGFITYFSPLKLKNGIYELHIFCYENENTMAIINTKKIFIKTFRSFKEFNFQEN